MEDIISNKTKIHQHMETLLKKHNIPNDMNFPEFNRNHAR